MLALSRVKEATNKDLRTLSVPRSEQFSESVARGNCELRGTDNVQGQISGHIFVPNEGYCLYYPSNIFRNTRGFKNEGNILGYSPVLAGEYLVT